MQGTDESVGAQVRPPLLRVRLDTLTSVISELDISDDEEDNGIGPLDPTALWVWVRLAMIQNEVVESGCWVMMNGPQNINIVKCTEYINLSEQGRILYCDG